MEQTKDVQNEKNIRRKHKTRNIEDISNYRIIEHANTDSTKSFKDILHSAEVKDIIRRIILS
ncbi:hypothetical protein HPK19_03295 [Arthrobacter citreus]|nr:hypothetical protein HPK19_03295 [Arthrobacter citreus]